MALACMELMCVVCRLIYDGWWKGKVMRLGRLATSLGDHLSSAPGCASPASPEAGVTIHPRGAWR